MATVRLFLDRVSLLLLLRVFGLTDNGHVHAFVHRGSASVRPWSPTATRLYNSLKPAALPLMDAGKAMARTGELLIDDVTNALDLYGGALSAAGAEVRNAGDCLAQAAASMRFKTGRELVVDELREAGNCFTQAASKCVLAIQEARQDDMTELVAVLEQMADPMAQTGDALEAAGAGILQGLAVHDVGQHLADAAEALAIVAALLPQLDVSGELAGQRLAFCAAKVTEASQELQGIQPAAPKGKSWLKGGR